MKYISLQNRLEGQPQTSQNARFVSNPFQNLLHKFKILARIRKGPLANGSDQIIQKQTPPTATNHNLCPESPPQSQKESQPLTSIDTTINPNIYRLLCASKPLNLYYSPHHPPDQLSAPYAMINNRLAYIDHNISRLYQDLWNIVGPECSKRGIPSAETALTPLACLSGRRYEDGEQIRLHPTILMSCASRVVKRIIRETMGKDAMRWTMDGNPRVEIHENLRLNGGRVQVEGLDLDKGFDLARPYQLYLHREGPEVGQSACGLVVCTTVTKQGVVIDQSISRLGGLVECNGTTYALSTSHGIMDTIVTAMTEPESPVSFATEESQSDCECGISSCIQQSDDDQSYQEWLHLRGSQKIAVWHSVPQILTMDFVKAASPGAENKWLLRNVSKPHDLAIFNLGYIQEPLQNSYTFDSTEYFVDDILEDVYLPKRESNVLVLLGKESHIVGNILPGGSPIFVNGIQFHTRRIMTERRLGPGTSGAWAVYGRFLCGVVIATNISEPISYIVTAQQFLENINTSIASASHISNDNQKMTSTNIGEAAIPQLKVRLAGDGFQPSWRTEISGAAAAGSLDAVKMLIEEKNAHPDLPDAEGRTPLSHAAAAGNPQVVRLLVNTWGMGIDFKDRRGRTPLLYAAKEGTTEIVCVLLNTKMVDPNRKDDQGRTPISYAAERGHDMIVRLFLSIGGLDLDSKDNKGRTPLSYAAEGGHKATVLLLLYVDPPFHALGIRRLTQIKGFRKQAKILFDTKGGVLIEKPCRRQVNPDSTDSNGRTPLSYAAERGHDMIVRLFLSIGGLDLDSKDNKGRTPLSYAAEGDHKATVQLLLYVDPPFHALGIRRLTQTKGFRKQAKILFDTKGGVLIEKPCRRQVNPDSTDSNGRTPLSYAAELGKGQSIELLLNHKCVNADQKDVAGRTPLSWAAESGQPHVVSMLLKKGVDVNCSDNRSRSSLSYAVSKGHFSSSKMLIEAGTQIDAADENGRTSLSYAAENGDPSIAKLLTSKGADPNCKDKQGRTPLWYAVRKGNLQFLAHLIEIGAELNFKDEDGRTSLSHASEHDWNSILTLLLENGAIVDSEDNHGRTPLWYAEENGWNHLVDRLIKRGAKLRTQNA